MNRQTKRQMAKAGTDKPARPSERRAPAQTRDRERTSPREFFAEVRGEMRKVAWPTRQEVLNSTVIVVIGVVVMTSIIFFFDWLSGGAVNHIFK